MTFNTAEPVTIGDEDSRNDVDVALQAGGSISGIVTSAATGQPLPSVNVDLLDSTGDSIRPTSTGEDGAYSFTGLATGNYLLKFTPNNEGTAHLSEFYDNAETEVGATLISIVAPNALDNIDVSLQPGSVIAGRLRAADEIERGLDNTKCCLKDHEFIVPSTLAKATYSWYLLGHLV